MTPTTIQTPGPVDQSNYYGSPGFDHDDAEQDSYTLRLEHDVNRRFTLRNQTRYNRAHRDAIISTIQNPAAYDSTTNQVAIVRQGNVRKHDRIEPDEHDRALFHRLAPSLLQLLQHRVHA